VRLPARLLRRIAALHAPDEQHAAAQGWTVTRTRMGTARRYRDPRFDRIAELRSAELDLHDT
jgi:hypothetical protein